MASVLEFPAGRSFTLKIFKRLDGQTTKEWSNQYEVMSIADGNIGDLNAFATVHAEFEKRIHLPSVRFTRWIVSTGAHEEPGSAFETFVEYPLDFLGTRGDAPGDPLDVRITAWVGKPAETGRPGKCFYRRCLAEGDVVSALGQFTYANLTFATLLADAAADAGLEDYWALGSNAILKERLINPDGSQYRDVIGYVLSGVVPLKTDHKYFDRA